MKGKKTEGASEPAVARTGEVQFLTASHSFGCKKRERGSKGGGGRQVSEWAKRRRMTRLTD